MRNSFISQRARSESLGMSLHLVCRDKGIWDSAHPPATSNGAAEGQDVGEAMQGLHHVLRDQHTTLQSQGANRHLVGANTLAVLHKALADGWCKCEPSKEEPLYEKAAGTITNQPVTGRPFTATPGKFQYANYDGDDYLSAYKDLDSLINCICKSENRINAVRTPPANANIEKKRLGAKDSKNLGKLESVSSELNPIEATPYHALSARSNISHKTSVILHMRLKNCVGNSPSPRSIVMPGLND